MGCFAYSEEDGTPAAEFGDQVPPKIRCGKVWEKV